MSQFKCISGERLAFIASTIAIALSKEFDLDDINILSGFFSAIGDNLAIIAAQRSACTSASDDKDAPKASDDEAKGKSEKDKD